MESVPPSSIGSCCMAIEIKTGRASTVRVHGNPQQKQATKRRQSKSWAEQLAYPAHILVGGIPTPLKNMSSSVGMMTFPTEWTKKTCPKPSSSYSEWVYKLTYSLGGLTLLLLFPGKLLGTQRCSCDFGSAEPRALLRTQRTLLACGLKT